MGTRVYICLLICSLVSCASHVEKANLGGGQFACGFRSESAERHKLPKQQASRIYFLSREIGWALCGDGLLCGTTNGGKTWQVLNRSDLKHAREIIFVTEQTGWAVIEGWPYEQRMDMVLRTQDGGRIWHKVLEIGSPIYGVDFLTEKIGYVVARWSPIYFTEDGGDSWQKLIVDMPIGISETLHKVFFLNSKSGWGYGAGIYHTEDGGVTWTEVVSPEAVAGILYRAAFVDEKAGWIVGSKRQVWRMTDGRTWRLIGQIPAAEGKPEEITGEPPDRFLSISCIDQNELWATADDNTVLHSTDGGKTWRIVSRWSCAIVAAAFINRDEGWAVDEEGRILQTIDGGVTWKERDVK